MRLRFRNDRIKMLTSPENRPPALTNSILCWCGDVKTIRFCLFDCEKRLKSFQCQ